MPDLRVDIAGVRFPNPILIGSCSLTSDVRTIQRLVEAGAGGIFTKTISPDPLPGPRRHFRTGLTDRSLAVSADPRVTVEEGEALIGRLRETVDVPIIANVIGRSDDGDVWGETCARLAAAGAHMIELDLNCHPEGGLEHTFDRHPQLVAYEGISIGQDAAATARVVRAVKAATDVPVVSKMTLRAPDMLAVAEASADAGADAISGVNALHALPAVDIEGDGVPLTPGMDVYALNPICGPALNVLGAKWTALLSQSIDLPYISGSGISSARDAIERIMLGAHALQICSTIYLNGPRVIAEIVDEVAAFLERDGSDSIEAIRGRALSLLEPRNQVAPSRVVARVADRRLWEQVAAEVYAKAELGCSCIVESDDGIGFDEARCTGCSLPWIHAPAGAVEMVRV